MTRETKRSTRASKRSARKTSTKKQTPVENNPEEDVQNKPLEEEVEVEENEEGGSTKYDSLNTSEKLNTTEEEKTTIMDTSSEPLNKEDQTEEMVTIKELEIKEEEKIEATEKEDGVVNPDLSGPGKEFGTNSADVDPSFSKFPIEEEKVPKVRAHKDSESKTGGPFPSRHVGVAPKLILAKEPSIFQGPLFKYGSIVLGILVFYFLFLRKGSGKKNGKEAAPGPTIVDVTEVKEGSSSDGDEKKSVKSSVNRVSSPRIVFGDLRKNPSLMVAPPMTPAVGSRG